MIILTERHFSIDLQGLSKPKPAFPVGEGRVRGWYRARPPSNYSVKDYRVVT